MSRSRRPRLATTRSGLELLRDFADGQLEASVAEGDDRPLIGDRVRLSESSQRLVRIAALSAVNAPTVLWVTQLGDDPAGVDLDDVAEVLLEIAPIIGGPRLVSAAEQALAAARYAEDVETT